MAEDSNLEHLRNYYLAVAYSWAGIFKLKLGESSTQEFELALALCKKILGNIPSNILQDFSDILGEIEDAKKKIDNIERFYVHLHILLFCYC